MTVRCIIACLLAAVSYGQEVVRSDELRNLVNRAYIVLDTNAQASLPLFETASRLAPSSVLIQRQLGWLYVNFGRTEEALSRFHVADSLLPSDTTKLQIAYLLQSLGRHQEALQVFSHLRASNDWDIRSKSRAAVVVVSADLSRRSYPWWSQANGTVYYESRFHNTVLMTSAYAGKYTGLDRIASLYGVLALTYDTRSMGGALPVIFSDNYLLGSVGLRLLPFAGLTTDFQMGAAVDLIERANHSRASGDIRCILSYGHGLYPELSVPDDLHFVFKPMGDIHMSLGYYSRYKNGIGYAQLRAGVRLAQWDHSAFDTYLRGNFAFDTERLVYNNIAESGLGVRFMPHYSWGVAVQAEWYRGTYWDKSVSAGSLTRSYNTIRLFVILDRSIF